MILRNSENKNKERENSPRGLDSKTIKNIENVAYTEKESMDQDVKIWDPKLSRT